MKNISMTYGILPDFELFLNHFDQHVHGTLYKIRNCRKFGNVDLTVFELYRSLEELNDSYNEEDLSLASSILSTLGFEWV
jgi:hypothetical protein